MGEQDKPHGELPQQQQTTGGETPSSDTGDIHRARPAVERQTEDGQAGQGLGQITGATREDAKNKAEG